MGKHSKNGSVSVGTEVELVLENGKILPIFSDRDGRNWRVLLEGKEVAFNDAVKVEASSESRSPSPEEGLAGRKSGRRKHSERFESSPLSSGRNSSRFHVSPVGDSGRSPEK